MSQELNEAEISSIIEDVKMKFLSEIIRDKFVAKLSDPLIKNKIDKAIDKAFSGLSDAYITLEVNNLLETVIKQNILTLLGFEKSSWDNKYKVDHCNGRSGNSPIGLFIQGSTKKIVEDFLNENLKPELEKGKKDLLLSSVQESIKNELYASCKREILGSLVKRVVADLSVELKEKISK